MANEESRAARRVRILISSGIQAVSTAEPVLIGIAANPSGVAPARAFAMSLLFLIGVCLLLLAYFAEQFPRAARVGEAIAMALRYYLLDGY